MRAIDTACEEYQAKRKRLVEMLREAQEREQRETLKRELQQLDQAWKTESEV